MNVSCLIGGLNPGGAERVFVRVVEHLAVAGHQVAVITVAEQSPKDLALPGGVSRTVVPSEDPRWFHPLRQLKRLRALRRALLAPQPDVVLSFLTETNIAALLALFGARVPAVVSERVDIRQHALSPRWEWLRRMTYIHAATVVVQTDDLANWLSRHRPRWRTMAIPNPVVPPTTAYGPLPASPMPPAVVLGMGRLVRQKGFDVLVAAFAQAAASRPGWGLLIVGEGPDRAALAEAARTAGISDRVLLPGRVDPPWQLFRSASIFVLSSRYEGFPNALAEAMSYGLPVISTDCPTGPSELIRDGVDGALVPVDDVPALAEVLAVFMDDERERRRLGTAATAVVDRFAAERVLPRWEHVLESAAARRR